MSDRINLTLNSELWARIDFYRGDLYMNRQEFVKHALSEHVKMLDKFQEQRELDSKHKRLSLENDELRSQLDNLKRDFQTATGKPAKIR